MKIFIEDNEPRLTDEYSIYELVREISTSYVAVYVVFKRSPHIGLYYDVVGGDVMRMLKVWL